MGSKSNIAEKPTPAKALGRRLIETPSPRPPKDEGIGEDCYIGICENGFLRVVLYNPSELIFAPNTAVVGIQLVKYYTKKFRVQKPPQSPEAGSKEGEYFDQDFKIAKSRLVYVDPNKCNYCEKNKTEECARYTARNNQIYQQFNAHKKIIFVGAIIPNNNTPGKPKTGFDISKGIATIALD